MKIRIASTLLALMLPLAAQEPAANQEAVFYKAYYLEKGARDIAAAMVLYQQFLDAVPDHKLAKEAAQYQYALLGSTGKTKERDAFKAKYEKLLGNVAPAPAAGDRPAGGGADAPRGRGEGQGRPGAGGDNQARIAELEKALAKAKEEGNAEEVKRLEGQLERARQGGRGAGGGNAGPGGRRGGLMGVLGNNKKISEMNAEEKTSLKDAVSNYTLNDRMREAIGADAAKKLEENVASLKKALDADKTEDAQKALDALRESMPRGGRRGGNGGGGGGNGGGGGGNGGGGNGGGGGGGR